VCVCVGGRGREGGASGHGTRPPAFPPPPLPSPRASLFAGKLTSPRAKNPDSSSSSRSNSLSHASQIIPRTLGKYRKLPGERDARVCCFGGFCCLRSRSLSSSSSTGFMGRATHQTAKRLESTRAMLTQAFLVNEMTSNTPRSAVD